MIHFKIWERKAATFLFAGFFVSSAGAQQSTVALAEMQQIANALELCAADTTYYVAPEALNDNNFSNTQPPYNYIGDQGGSFVLFPDQGYFRASRINLATAFLQWRGPYLSYQPQRTQLDTQPYDLGSPLDPWGAPYFLFSPLGLLRGDTGQVTNELYADSFDRYVLVSLGPDGVRSSDDIGYFFGGGVSAFRISSLRSTNQVLLPPKSISKLEAIGLKSTSVADGYRATAGSEIIVRGTNFGSSQGAAVVYWGTTQLTDIPGWAQREVRVKLPAGVTGTANLRIERPPAITNEVPLTIEAAPTAAEEWQHYY